MAPTPTPRATPPTRSRRRNGSVRAVAATALILFAGTFGLLGVNLASGNDPSLGSGTTTSGTTTVAQTSSASSTSSSTTAATTSPSTTSSTSSSAQSSSATPATAQTSTS